MPIKRENSLSDFKLINKNLINEYCSNKILDKYPYYKQLNISRTSDATYMYTWIDNIRNLSNIANNNIDISESTETIYTIVKDFKNNIDQIS